MASKTMIEQAQDISTPRKLLSLFHRQQTYWDRLTAESKEECVNRQASRRIGGLEAFDPSGPIREKWDKEIYPKISNILNQEKATILKRVRKDIPYVFHLYMINREAVIVPAFVTICINTDTAGEVVKVARKHLKAENIGLKYLVFRSLLSPTGHQLRSNNLCGTAIEFSVHGGWSRPRGDLPCLTSTMGGCILMGDEAFGLTTAHSFGGPPSDPNEDTESPDEASWVSDSDEESEVHDTEYLMPLGIAETHEQQLQATPDSGHPIWEVSISNLTCDITSEVLASMLPAALSSSLFSIEILHTEPVEESGLKTGIARFSNAVDAAAIQVLLHGIPNAARNANLCVFLRQTQFVDDTLDLQVYGWIQDGNSDNLLPLLADNSSLVSCQSSLRDDWLLIPLG